MCTDRFIVVFDCYTKAVMKKLFKYSCEVSLGLFLLVAPHFASAAALYIDPSKSTLNRGDAITMSVRLDVDEISEECINAVDAVITYSANIEPVDATVGDSIFSLWVEKPTINREQRTITFAGGTPNGYCGRLAGDPRLTNTLAKLVFRSPGFTVGGSDELTATVAFTDASTVYLNDGFGTPVRPDIYGATIDLNQKAGSTMLNEWKDEVSADNIKPEEFSILLQKDDQAFSQKYYIIFNTTDKQTGIDHYEVMEESLAQFGTFQWGRADAPWVEQRSPYILRDQSLNSIIRVKAIDKAGNEYLANLIPDVSMRTISRNQLYIFVGGGFSLIFLAMVSFIIIRMLRIRRAKKELLVEDRPEGDSEDTNINNTYDV
jgi:hypothetical protein